MLIALHVILALGSIALSIFSNIRLDKSRLDASYVMVGGTLVSGVLLIIINGASIMRTCVTGLVFFAAVAIVNESTRRKLASTN